MCFVLNEGLLLFRGDSDEDHLQKRVFGDSKFRSERLLASDGRMSLDDDSICGDTALRALSETRETVLISDIDVLKSLTMCFSKGDCKVCSSDSASSS
mmetsp:Transcript_74562/g.112344  ORF Transcript_74562/g.112344 Transcript_74562/m.112344 type:complete len:98 (-) Transcript_74562:34-327(-)